MNILILLAVILIVGIIIWCYLHFTRKRNEKLLCKVIKEMIQTNKEWSEKWSEKTNIGGTDNET